MSDRIKAIIGEELYNQVIAKGIKANEFDLLDGFIPKSRFDDINEKYKNEQTKVTTYETQITGYKKTIGDNADYKQKFEELDKTTKLEFEKLEKTNKLNTLKMHARDALKKVGAKHPNLLLNELDFDKMSLEGDNVIGLNDQIKTVKTNFKDMFIEIKNNPNDKSKNIDDKNTNNDFSQLNLGLDKVDNDMDWGSLVDNLVG